MKTTTPWRALLAAALMTLGAAATAGEAPDGSAATPGPGESRQANPGGTTEGVNPAATPAGRGMGGSAGSTGGAGEGAQGAPGSTRESPSGGHTGITPHEAEAMAEGAQKTPTPPAGATQGAGAEAAPKR